MQDEEFMASIRRESPLLPDNGPWDKVIGVEMRVYTVIQKFEGQIPKEGRAKNIIGVAMEPASGEDADFDDWYRKQVWGVAGECTSRRY